ncbi:MAG: HAMP domain-containing protein [Alphaproteobacteria bacterium]|nr:HAMP domain-containing protein [Alphaproteobacteria bacterium]
MIARLFHSLTGRMILLLMAAIGAIQASSVILFVDREGAIQLERRRDEFLRIGEMLLREINTLPFDQAARRADGYRDSAFRFEVLREPTLRDHEPTARERDFAQRFATRFADINGIEPDIELLPYPIGIWTQFMNGLGLGQTEIWFPPDRSNRFGPGAPRPSEGIDLSRSRPPQGPPGGASAASPEMPEGPPPGRRPPRRIGTEGPPPDRAGIVIPAGATRWPPVNLRMRVRLASGAWMVGDYLYPPEGDRPWLVALVGQVMLSALAVVIISIFLVRWNLVSMKRLAAADRQIGHGERIDALPLDGPIEVRQVTQSFNDMNQRLGRLIEGRMRMLAAISHDLRTPITSLKIRAEMVDDEETRQKMLATLDDMHALAESTLAIACDDAALGDTKQVDLAALVQSVCDDFADIGKPVTMAPIERILHVCRPDGIKRVLRNLIENALKYGRQADVTVAAKGDSVEITIDDAGPGIPPEQMKRMFQPFVRLETSRSRETGGF